MGVAIATEGVLRVRGVYVRPSARRRESLARRQTRRHPCVYTKENTLRSQRVFTFSCSQTVPRWYTAVVVESTFCSFEDLSIKNWVSDAFQECVRTL